MLELIASVFFVAAFAVMADRLGLPEKSGNVIAVTRHSLSVVLDSELREHEKEAELRKAARQLFRLSGSIALSGLLSLLPPLGVLWVCDRLGLVSLSAVHQTILSPMFLICGGVLSLLFLGWRRSSSQGDRRYTMIEKALHHTAFKTYPVQTAIADFENRLFSVHLESIKIDRPVFVTALPRAGTTILLESLVSTGDFASHCYRDMPFVLVPCLWNSFSSLFQKGGHVQERAHGDGILIDFDSPEALEEVVWKTYWGQHYLSDRIIPWGGQSDEDFEDFFRTHMTKVIFLRRTSGRSNKRYLSKNNLNIARTSLLLDLFPDSRVLVPFRQPVQHAASLLNQHLNFLALHREDPFSAKYMEAIGHYDFGMNLRPVDFGNWFDDRECTDTKSLAFWLDYWVAAYSYLLARPAGSLSFVSFDALCEDPKNGLVALADAIDTSPETMLVAGSRLRPPKPRNVDAGTIPPRLVERSNDIYIQLRSTAIF